MHPLVWCGWGSLACDDREGGATVHWKTEIEVKEVEEGVVEEEEETARGRAEQSRSKWKILRGFSCLWGVFCLHHRKNPTISLPTTAGVCPATLFQFPPSPCSPSPSPSPHRYVHTTQLAGNSPSVYHPSIYTQTW